MIAIFPEIAAAAGDMQIETASYLVRKYFGEKQAFQPKINIVSLSQSVGIPVSTTDMEDYGALVVKDDKGRFEAQIVINTEQADLKERNFLVAHLLGHFFLHVQPHIVRGEWPNTGFRETYSPMLRFQQDSYQVLGEEAQQMEAEADLFAAALLLPKAMLKRALAKLKNQELLSQFFNVNPLLLQRRLECSGLMEGQRPSNFLGAEASLKKTTQAPSSKTRQAGAAQKDDKLSSAARVKRNIAVSGYKDNNSNKPSPQKETKATSKAAYSTSANEQQKNPLEQSLKMFRDLASRLDSSVDPKE